MDRKLILIVGITLALSSCASSERKPLTPSIEDGMIQLAETADAVGRSLNELAEIERANTPRSAYKTLVDLRGMEDPLAVDWTGPVEALLKRIAHLSGYRFRVLGAQPVTPIIITLTTKETPLADIVRNIDFQCDRRARLFVNQRRHTLELRYTE